MRIDVVFYSVVDKVFGFNVQTFCGTWLGPDSEHFGSLIDCRCEVLYRAEAVFLEYSISGEAVKFVA